MEKHVLINHLTTMANLFEKVSNDETKKILSSAPANCLVDMEDVKVLREVVDILKALKEDPREPKGGA